MRKKLEEKKRKIKLIWIFHLLDNKHEEIVLPNVFQNGFTSAVPKQELELEVFFEGPQQCRIGST